jgi:hypothetical protein
MDYPAWCRVVRGAVHWATGYDPCQPRAGLRETDPEAAARAALVNGWAEITAILGPLTTATAIDTLANTAAGEHRPPEQFGTLRRALMEISRDGSLPSPKALSRALSAIRGRVIAGKIVEAKPYKGTMEWSVRDAKPSKP